MDNGAKTIKFVDRTFNISRSYAMEMFQFLIDEHRPGTVFQFEITADIMRPEVIQFLNEKHLPDYSALKLAFNLRMIIQMNWFTANKILKN